MNIEKYNKTSNELSVIRENANLQFLSFFIDKSFFGIEILDIKEVNLEFELTPIFHAPEGVRGFVNLRGQIYMIIDLRKSLGITSEPTEKEKLLLIKDHIAGQTGIIVDDIGDVISVEAEQIELSSSNTNKDELENISNKNIVHGVCKLKNKLMIILNANNLLDILKNKE
jgi:purine-binding chemotaxis protein CheW